MKVAFNPHIVGYGHRVRCNLIAREIVKLRTKARIVFLDRKDDPLFGKNWTEFKRARGKFARNLEMFTSSCFVEDGVFFKGLRRKLYASYGRLVTIVQPDIDEDFLNPHALLRSSDLIIIPFPKDIFPPPSYLCDFNEKVMWVGPVLNLPPDDLRVEKTDRPIVCVTASREKAVISSVIRAAEKDISVTFREPSFKSDNDYFSSIFSATALVTQGTTGVFEAVYFGIPQVCIPISKEQLIVAKKMSQLGLLRYIPLEELSAERFRRAVSDILGDRTSRLELAERGRKIVPGSGASDIAKAIVKLVES